MAKLRFVKDVKTKNVHKVRKKRIYKYLFFILLGLNIIYGIHLYIK